ncbi:hypothetical protein A2627_00135 [Candidatus Woesebacteria bacterium RIFCSPHIGHO2_01_FULL_39_28]|uniref:Type II secretion system protein GspG C-terminal domain-containing protein n=1 Tax=Candidatus Woesebacteria bacterium RIFCSPHIGHO2_01_FULL_39_28 TaxID=1802496 RepID=A0A1F7YCV6_9BACT|nr:MAG: hypothetical protein A2627_00135 [Candidatus Woesebacteria bacterium RIFCSPHIGHO2_01_FULL_39_28]OGM57879.1 MAG: hypothetical protein A3A50_04565 [Candidatus Woesebacteria bacterium RIFCSPLOWO2_01_FULL_38_20]
MKKTATTGFTIVELLIVLAVLGVMVGFFLVTFPGARASARDTQRRSDLKQFQTGLESFANRNNGLYPSRNVTTPTSTLCTDIGFTGCPTDPASPQVYNYISDGSGAGAASATVYVLWATLEKPASPVTYWVVCSNGKSGTVTTTPSSSACPLT